MHFKAGVYETESRYDLGFCKLLRFNVEAAEVSRADSWSRVGWIWKYRERVTRNSQHRPLPSG